MSPCHGEDRRFESDRARQNIIIVLIILIFFSSNAFASTFKSKDTKNINSIIPEETKEPFFIQPTPSTKPTEPDNLNPKPTITPTGSTLIVPSPMPKREMDWILYCNGPHKLTEAEYHNSVCCSSGGTQKITTNAECEIEYQKIHDEYEKKLNSYIENSINEETFEPNPTKYKECVDKAQYDYEKNIENGMYETGALNIKTGRNNDCSILYQNL